MSLKYLIRRTLILFTLVSSWTVSHSQVESGIIVDEIIAKVDNYIVLKSDLDGAYINYLSSGNPAAPDAKCRILAQLISGKLMVAKAEIDSVIVLDAEVDNNLNRRMQLILSQYGGSEKQLEEYYGKSIEQIQNDVRDEIKEQLVVQRMQETIISDVRVTPAEVKKFYNKIPSDSLPYFSTEVEVGQIVRIPKVSNDQKNELKKKLAGIRERIMKGEDFGTLAKEYSQGPSAKFGGNLSFNPRGVMAPEFEAAALSQKTGGISKPFETQFGIHIVQLLEKRGNEYNSRHILLIPEPSEEDIQKSSMFLDSLSQKISVDSISFEKAAKELSEDPRTAGSGGFFTDELGGNRVPVEKLDPVVFFTIDSMDVGNISKPITFRTDDGKEAVRILYYKSRLAPHQANLKQDWQKIQAATENQKKSQVLNKWFDKAREDVFISLDDIYDSCGILKQ